MNVRSVTLLALLAIGPAAASAQTPSNPFLGSAPPPGPPSPQPVALSLKDAVTRGLQYNLGLLLQESSSTQARGARWRALADLLPNVSSDAQRAAAGDQPRAVYGFPTDPSIIGPFNVFDARVALSQPVIDLRAFNDYARRGAQRARRGATASRRRAISSCWSPSTSISRRSTAASRIDVVRAQQETAEALFQQASDLKASGSSPASTCCARRSSCRTSASARSSRENEFEKAKLQLARAIGLPPGQAFTLTDKIPYAPLADIDARGRAGARATRRAPDYLAAHERLEAAEATRRAAGADAPAALHLDADYGTIGQTASDAAPDLHRRRQPSACRSSRPDAPRRGASRRTRSCSGARRSSRTSRAASISRSASSLLDLRAAAQQLEAAQTTVTLANQELEQARDRFAAGVASNLEVTQAQETVAAASESYIAALYAHNLAKASLARAVGIAETAVMQYLGGVQ